MSRIDVASEWLRPREEPVKPPEEAESADKLFKRAQTLGLKLIVEVKKDRNYFSSFSAVDNSGKSVIIFNEPYQETRLSGKDSRNADKISEVYWNCVATAKHRLLLKPEGLSTTIKTDFMTFQESDFDKLSEILKKQNTRILTAVRKP